MKTKTTVIQFPIINDYTFKEYKVDNQGQCRLLHIGKYEEKIVSDGQYAY